MKIVSKTLYQNGNITELACDGNFVSTYSEMNRLNVYPVEKQMLLGFGGAFTNSSAYLYSQMSQAEKEETLEALFGESGLRYNFCRLCISSSDFSPYDYLNVKEGDESLASFNIDEDKKYIIPFVKDAIKKAKNEIIIFASPWSPPAFMKENGSRYNGGKLKKEYYELWAEYMVRFVEEYAKEGIKISAFTTQNEPNAKQTWESCYYDAEDELNFIFVLAKVIEKHGLDTKILFWDHNKEGLYDRASKIYAKAADKVWGIGFHWYSGSHYDAITMLRDLYPDKMIFATEFCKGLKSGSKFNFRSEYLQDIRCGSNGLCEWNLILDDEGGPFHNRCGGCTSPIVFDRQSGKISKKPLWGIEYSLAHFVERGARVLCTSTYDTEIGIVAVRNPDGKIIVCIDNETNVEQPVTLNYMQLEHNFKLPADSMLTLVISTED